MFNQFLKSIWNQPKWLGSFLHRKDLLLNLRLSDEPIYALGIYFPYNEELAIQKKNFFDKLNPFRELLNIRFFKNVSKYGRINMLKPSQYLN